MIKWKKTSRIEEILVSSSSLVSGLSEASGVRFSWVEVSQESLTNMKNLGPDPWVLRGCYKGLKSSKKVRKICEIPSLHARV